MNYLNGASGKFSQEGWSEEYGGLLWARIADAGYALWASKDMSQQLIDYIFDLQHNSGNIFDKDNESVKQDDSSLQTILDLKRNEDIWDILPKLKGICSEEAINEAYAKLRIVKSVVGYSRNT